MTAPEGWFIGELSHRLEIPIHTIRYYEQLGLLNPVRRNRSGYRVYSPEAEKRLRFIQKAKRFGLSLGEIKTLIEIRVEGTPPCADLREMVKQHLDDLDRQIRDMLAFRKELMARYQQIEAVLSDSSAPLSEVTRDSQICGLIEQDSVPN